MLPRRYQCWRADHELGWAVTDPTQFRPGTYQALGSINGGEVISADSY
jgi:hypothetical protein